MLVILRLSLSLAQVDRIMSRNSEINTSNKLKLSLAWTKTWRLRINWLGYTGVPKLATTTTIIMIIIGPNASHLYGICSHSMIIIFLLEKVIVAFRDTFEKPNGLES